MARKSVVKRETKETQVLVKIDLDKKTKTKISTTIPFFDHMLTLFSFHSGIGLRIEAKGDIDIDHHHLVEDVGIVLGEAFNKALGDKKGISRYGEVLTPMDEALSYVVVDISGRPLLRYKVKFHPEYRKSDFDYSLIKEFFHSFVNNAKITLHIKILDGENNHHIAESIFKGVGRAIKKAITITTKNLPSTKGKI